MKLISVVIPTLNEEKTIDKTLKHVQGLSGKKEIIVVDGGSHDKTRELARERADMVVKTRKGRGHQLNVGAEMASGEIILFLHSDCRLDKGGLVAIDESLKDSSYIGGAFSLRIDDQAWPLRFISWSSNLRARYMNLIFGDQGIFIRKSVFKELGGYPDIPLMEDWEFSKNMAAVGKLVFLPEKIYTSARRWHKYGIWRTIFLMHKIKILYLLGVDPVHLNKIYRDAR